MAETLKQTRDIQILHGGILENYVIKGSQVKGYYTETRTVFTLIKTTQYNNNKMEGFGNIDTTANF